MFFRLPFWLKPCLSLVFLISLLSRPWQPSLLHSLHAICKRSSGPSSAGIISLAPASWWLGSHTALRYGTHTTPLATAVSDARYWRGDQFWFWHPGRFPDSRAGPASPSPAGFGSAFLRGTVLGLMTVFPRPVALVSAVFRICCQILFSNGLSPALDPAYPRGSVRLPAALRDQSFYGLRSGVSAHRVA